MMMQLAEYSLSTELIEEVLEVLEVLCLLLILPAGLRLSPDLPAKSCGGRGWHQGKQVERSLSTLLCTKLDGRVEARDW